MTLATTSATTQNATKSGYKFYDKNKDGTWQTDVEPPLTGWTIYADLNGSKTWDEGEPYDVTDELGYYELSLKPGTYMILEVLKGTWTQTYPTLNENYGHFVTLTSGELHEDNNFGNWVMMSQLTDTSFCPLPNDQFRLNYVLDAPSTYRLNASNPGQFYYNVWYYGTPGDPVNLSITIPYPFVTNGANPIQVHDSVTTDGAGCYTPGTSLTGFTIETAGDNQSPSGYDIITLGDYSPQAIGSFTTVNGVRVIPDSTTATNGGVGLVYVTIHLDYGLKRTSLWSRNTTTGTATNPTYGAITSPQTYNFGFTDGGDVTDAQTPKSVNEFKKSVGNAGFTVKTGTEAPLANVKVEMRDAKKVLVGSASTDADGFYFINYKWTGKAANFTVTVPAYKITKTITLKANGFVVTDFVLP